ncbi:hypothetical protein [Haloferax volcanii]|uniref:hypothetical protein n=1 Tax=Haloferax volcanii TaxID=2246 RepID=UPI00249C196C|nr:hypothetical protein [Haloferax alexandrinus]WEL29817.1 hypothetical protein HBNXHx_1711 [Haloferax alexandrinus]
MQQFASDRIKNSVNDRAESLVCDGGEVEPHDDEERDHFETFVGTVVMTPDEELTFIVDDGSDTETIAGSLWAAPNDLDLGDDVAVTGVRTDDDRLVATDLTRVETPFFGWCADCMARHEVERVTNGCQCGGRVIPEPHVDEAGLEWSDERELVTDGGVEIIRACPECNESNVRTRSPGTRGAIGDDEAHYCGECGASFDDPVERPRDPKGGIPGHTLAARLEAADPDDLGLSPRGERFVTDGGRTLTACPNCDSAQINSRQPEHPTSRLEESAPRYHCGDCDSDFDHPVEREARAEVGTNPESLAARLEEADPEDVGLSPAGERLVTDGGRDPADDPFACSICGCYLGEFDRVRGEDYCESCRRESAARPSDEAHLGHGPIPDGGPYDVDVEAEQAILETIGDLSDPERCGVPAGKVIETVLEKPTIDVADVGQALRDLYFNGDIYQPSGLTLGRVESDGGQYDVDGERAPKHGLFATEEVLRPKLKARAMRALIEPGDDVRVDDESVYRVVALDHHDGAICWALDAPVTDVRVIAYRDMECIESARSRLVDELSLLSDDELRRQFDALIEEMDARSKTVMTDGGVDVEDCEVTVPDEFGEWPHDAKRFVLAEANSAIDLRVEINNIVGLSNDEFRSDNASSFTKEELAGILMALGGPE